MLLFINIFQLLESLKAKVYCHASTIKWTLIFFPHDLLLHVHVCNCTFPGYILFTYMYSVTVVPFPLLQIYQKICHALFRLLLFVNVAVSFKIRKWYIWLILNKVPIPLFLLC